MSDLQYLPLGTHKYRSHLVIELQSVKRKKAHMESQLREAEAGISLFSRSNVYVPTVDYVNFTDTENVQ